jgi:hypothetical protein
MSSRISGGSPGQFDAMCAMPTAPHSGLRGAARNSAATIHCWSSEFERE